MFCENCGNKLLEGTKFCSSCGTKTQAAQPAHAAADSVPMRPLPPPAHTQAAPSYQPSNAPQLPTCFGKPGSEPLRVGQYIGMLLLMCIPILNIVLLFMWSFGGSVNQNKKNFARASLVLGVTGLVLSILLGVALRNIIG